MRMDASKPSPATLSRDLAIQDYLHLIGLTVLVYDHLITFGDEVRLLWRRRRTPSANWYFVVRYLGLAGNIPVAVFSFYSLPDKWCHFYHVGHQIVIIGTQLLAGVVMLLRTYALYNHKRCLLLTLLAVSALLLTIVVWSIMGQQSWDIEGFPGCNIVVSETAQYHLAGAWESLFAYDALIFGLTLYKTYKTRCQVGLGSYEHIPVHALILRDGAMYFGTMALVTLGNLLTFYLAGPVLAGSLSTLASCTAVTLISRLLLNLHEKTDNAIFSAAQLPTDMSLSMDFVVDASRDGGEGERPVGE
uniref:DUF6533 domain-containing protein n=1 Tax=Mycena chlorophos TaxID=658473 RepID=A0ABQ0LMQ1_MYCCL|nr:predicted protein [Mycena chlorophos]